MNKNLIYDVITFGAGSGDIYLKSEKFARDKKICFELGSKNEVEDIMMFSGGGGTNAAVTFAKQGLKTAFCGQVGKDYFGDSIIKELKDLKIDTSLVLRTKNKPTNVSVFLAYPGKDRTILVYRGASDALSKKDIPWLKIKNTKWFYLAPFSGKLAELTDDLIDFAKKNNIKVAFNPGYGQLTLPKPILKKILDKVDVLILNKKEAKQLAVGREFKGITVITKGAEGVEVFDGKYKYLAKSLSFKIVDTTGAGDSFGSGFIAGLIQKNNIIYAVQLAMANSGYNITEWGAKDGLLGKNQKWPKVKVEKILLK